MRSGESSSTIITSIFFIMWVGSVVVYLNASFLGSHMSIFQSICLLGYCVFPINIVSLITYLLGGFLIPSLKLLLVAISFIWATLCTNPINLGSVSFIGELIPSRKRKLALYPIFLFYLFLSWFVLIVWNHLTSLKLFPSLILNNIFLPLDRRLWKNSVKTRILLSFLEKIHLIKC